MDIIMERYDYAIPLIIAFVLLFNLLAMFTLYMRKDRDHLVRVTLMFICNLSISDLLVGAMLLVNTILHYYYENTDVSGRRETLMKIMTLIENFVVRLTLLVAGVTIFIVTFIRIFALTRTYFRYRINRQMTLNINTVTWIICAVVVGVYNSIFEFYLRRIGYGRFEDIIIPGFVFSCLLSLFISHIIIFKILRSHGMSMKTYLQTLRTYIGSHRSLKTISTRSLFTASFGRKARKKKNVKKFQEKHEDTNETGDQHYVIENNAIGKTYDSHSKTQQQQQQQQQQQYSNSASLAPISRDRSSTKDKERCRKQIKFLFGTKDVSLLRFEALAFSLCWLPLAIIVLLHILKSDLLLYNYQHMEQYLLLLVYMKSVFTPCLYLMYAKHEFVCISRTFKSTEAENTLDSSCSTIITTM